MMNTQEIQGQWGQLRGKLKEKWGQLTNDDLQIVNGNVEQVIYRIQQRVGADRRVVEEFLEKNLPDQSQINRAKEAVMDHVQGAAETVREGYEELAGQFGEGVDRAARVVREHPGQSMATVLAGGVLAGIVVGLLISSD